MLCLEEEQNDKNFSPDGAFLNRLVEKVLSTDPFKDNVSLKSSIEPEETFKFFLNDFR